MATHTYSNLMLKVYEILGLFNKNENRRDIRQWSNFISYQEFFSASNIKIIGLIDPQKVYSQEKRLEIFYRYEQLFNGIVSTVVISIEDKESITERYAKTVIPSVIALDMYTTIFNKSSENKKGFYFYILDFIRSELSSLEENDVRGLFESVRKYIKAYIKLLNLDKSIDLSGLWTMIGNIRPGVTQKPSTISQHLELCRMQFKEMKAQGVEKLDSLEICYLSLNTLLTFENETSMIALVKRNLDELFAGNYGHTHLLSRLYQYLYNPSFDMVSLRACIDKIIDSAELTAGCDYPSEVYSYVENVKGVFFNPNVDKLSNKSEVINSNVKYNKFDYAHVLKPYSELIGVVSLIDKGSLSLAYEKISVLNFKSLPYGYLSRAFGDLYLALKIKLDKRSIKRGSLVPLLNNSLINQGVYTLPVIAVPDYPQLSECIDANNLTIMRAVKTYNNLIKKRINWDSIPDEVIDNRFITGLLKDVDVASEKLISLFHQTESLSNAQVAEFALESKLFTKRELNENLIGVLSDCTLYNCLCTFDVTLLISHLRSPDEILSSMRCFSGSSCESMLFREKARNVLPLITSQNSTH